MRFRPLIQNSSRYFSRFKWYALHKHSQAQNNIFQVYTYYISGSSQALEVPFRSPTKPGNSCDFFINLIIRECRSTLYVGLQHAVLPTNTKFKPLLLLTQIGMPYTSTHKHRTSYFKSTLTFLGRAKLWKCLSAARRHPEILAVLHNQRVW